MFFFENHLFVDYFFFCVVVLYPIIYPFHVNPCLIILYRMEIVKIFLIFQQHLYVLVILIMGLKVMFLENIIDIGNLLKRKIHLIMT